MPIGTKKLCYPKNFQWNATVPVYLVVTAKNLGRWLHHFIKSVERIFTETNDTNLHVIIYDYNSSDINLEEVLKQSSLINYMLIRQSGAYSRTQSFTEAVNLVSDPQTIIFMVDLHLHIASPLINNIRKVSVLAICYIPKKYPPPPPLLLPVVPVGNERGCTLLGVVSSSTSKLTQGSTHRPIPLPSPD